MFNFLQQRGMWSRFKNDTRGNFALIWALGLTATIATVGAGIDLSTAARVSSTAQAAADQVALASAVFYSNYERLPENSDEGFVDGEIYRGTDTGYSFSNAVYGGDKRVKIRADYDEEKGEVVVKVYGNVKTSFMGMFHKDYKKLPFESVATAKFKNIALKNPASITLVLDNSGSMAWDDKVAENCVEIYNNVRRRFLDYCDSPNDAEPRIEGLKDSTQNFMEILDGFVGAQAVTGKRVLRTGMIPYDDEVIGNRVVDMDWGVLSNGDIQSMSPSGSTNSAPPIAQAWEWLQDENDVHAAETGEENPLRYMIFMTDGQNSAQRHWIPKDGTNYWRGWDCTREFSQWCIRDYVRSPSMPNLPGHSHWQEGELVSESDRDSINTCNAMKAQGVRVFTIGFALEPGIYVTNYHPSWNFPSSQIFPVSTEAAYAMLADCASAPEDFVAAENADTLDAAFAVIGESIIQDVVRLSQ